MMMDHLRTVLIVIHFVAITVIALPSVKGLRPAHLRHPEAQQTIATLSEVTGASAEDITAWVLDAGDRLNATRRTILRPFQPYYTYAGTRQSWRMFGVINHAPARLEVHSRQREALPWEALFVSGDPKHDWLASKLDHVRMRSMIASFSYRRERWLYDVFVDWLVEEAARTGVDGSLQVLMRPCPVRTPAQRRRSPSLQCTEPYWTVVRELP